ncbi:MAG: Do family serine endopeptidase [Hyphomicrobiaceae bacterium]|nr:Do family serine endopeptidase [Hyphomicrobiaceae bacterium]
MKTAAAAVMMAAGLVSALLIASSDGLAQRVTTDKLAPPSREVAQYSFAPIVRTATPAVVNVYVRSRVKAFASPFANDPFFERFFGGRFGQPSDRVQSSLGSGVIVTADGVVVTNAHVLKAGGGETEIRVALSDKREFDAKLIASDEKNDIAVLRIEGGDGRFPFLVFEDSDTLEVGDLVLAIGNPFGVGQTVTSGIVSALARSEIGASDTQVFIQTDAAINPGNSGGALVDMSGKLVGINTAIFSRSGGSHGIGFAIPSNLVRVYVDSALKGKKLERPWLGAKLEPVTREIAEDLKLDRVTGAVVTRVLNTGPANEAGLQPGDVILRVDGFEATDPRSVLYRLQTKGVGNAARLDIVRKGKPVGVSIPVVAAPVPGKDDIRNLSGKHPLDGARVVNILPGIADDLGVDETSGVAVLSVRPGSISARLGFQPGDVVMTIGQQEIASVSALETALRDRPRYWQMSVKRGGQLLQLQVPA